VPHTTESSGSADEELAEAWQLLMGLVLDQRWRWPEISEVLGISQAGLRALLAIDPDDPHPMRDLARAMNCDASYVTAMVDDLEQAGGTPNVVRRLKTADSRSWRSPTPASRLSAQLATGCSHRRHSCPG
jgi:DNA-binding MarR family transcriptional regulator